MGILKKAGPRQAKTSSPAVQIQSEFLAKMSHELRTPLNAIIGFSEMIRNEKAGTINKEQREYLNDILASAKDLLGLINKVSKLSKQALLKKLNKRPKMLSKISKRGS